MPGNLLERLGGLFGRHSESPPAEATPAEAAQPTAVEPPPIEAPAEPTPVARAETPPVPAPVEAAAPPIAATPPQQAPVETVAAAPAAPTKSPEEVMEDRLWAETDEAWARGDFQTVTERLDALKALEPEDAAAIDEKIAAAQFNHAGQIERSGDLRRALYLYQEAQRRNPNLGEAGFAISASRPRSTRLRRPRRPSRPGSRGRRSGRTPSRGATPCRRSRSDSTVRLMSTRRSSRPTEINLTTPT